MGRHSDPDTLALIERLKQKGISLGFWVKEEYVLKKGQYSVDLVWKINEDQDPFVTFEIETADGERVFSNTAKIYDTSSDYVTKPWFHFMIIHKSNLSEGHKHSLFRQLSSNNVRLYESTFNDEEKIQSLENDLEMFGLKIIPLLKRYVENASLGESLPEIIETINEKLKGYPLANPRLKWSIETDKPQEAPDDAVHFTLKHKTKIGEPLLLDQMKEAIEKRMPLVIENPNLEVKHDKEGIFKDAKKFEKVVIGFKNALPPIILTVPSKSVSINNLIFSVIKNDENSYCISTEDRNEPYFFEFCIDKKEKGANFRIRLDKDAATPDQTQDLENLLMQAQKEDQLILLNTLNDEVFEKFHVKSLKTSDSPIS